MNTTGVRERKPVNNNQGFMRLAHLSRWQPGEDPAESRSYGWRIIFIPTER